MRKSGEEKWIEKMKTSIEKVEGEREKKVTKESRAKLQQERGERY